jgi:hypothetical protein
VRKCDTAPQLSRCWPCRAPARERCTSVRFECHTPSPAAFLLLVDAASHRVQLYCSPLPADADVVYSREINTDMRIGEPGQQLPHPLYLNNQNAVGPHTGSAMQQQAQPI